MKKEIFPALFDRILILFLLVLSDIVTAVTIFKLKRDVLVTAFASILFDQKAIFPGAEEYDGIIQVIMPTRHVNDIASLCENSHPSTLNN